MRYRALKRTKAKACPTCHKVKWFAEEERYTVECCGGLINAPADSALFYVNAGFNAENIKNSDKKAIFHNGINEYIPAHATKRYIDERAARKGLTVHWNTDARKLRGTKVSVPNRLS